MFPCQGEFEDFTTRWYVVVASSLTLTMLLNAFTSNIPMLVKKWVVFPLKRKLLLKSRVTQRQLNLLYVSGVNRLLSTAA